LLTNFITQYNIHRGMVGWFWDSGLVYFGEQVLFLAIGSFQLGFLIRHSLNN
jgi:hypothetical protein